jgi:hypothetical protein
MVRSIELRTCDCSHCKGRAAVCMDAFDWVDKSDLRHALRHAQEDLLSYFDRLPAEVKAALTEADVNVCSWCAAIWADSYGAANAARIIRAVRFVDDTRAIVKLFVE